MSAPDVQIRPAVATDLSHVTRIAGESPAAPPWTAQQYDEVLSPPPEGSALRRTILVATSQEQVSGFVVVSALCAVYPAEAEVESLAVSLGFRRRGLGRSLLDAAAAWSQAQGADVLRLEVRAGNGGALRLYAANGFRQTGTRPGYYARPAEDAVCMERTLRSIEGQDRAHS